MKDAPIVVWSSECRDFRGRMKIEVMFFSWLYLIPDHGNIVVTIGTGLFVVESEGVKHLMDHGTVSVGTGWGFVVEDLTKLTKLFGVHLHTQG